MQRSGRARNRLLAAAVLLLLFVPAAVPAHAVSKEMVQLQTQVQQLLDMVQRLQSTLDSHFGVMQNLAQQTADEAKQMTQTVNALQQKLSGESDAVNGKQDALSGQMQSLNDSVDELKARIAKLDKSVQDLQSQLQAMQTAQQAQTAPGGAQPGTAPPGGTQPGAPPSPGSPDQTPGAPQNIPAGANAPGPSPALQAPPLQETYQAGERDFDAGRFKVAQGEFESIVHYYPLDDLAGSAEFYLGEIAYQQKDYANAINYYNEVLEGFSGNRNAPAAELHKGYSLLATDKRQEGIDELRELIRRYPQRPEARQARSKLYGMGVRPTAGH